jgi:soluble lytic murein transglycosylase-like protein
MSYHRTLLALTLIVLSVGCARAERSSNPAAYTTPGSIRALVVNEAYAMGVAPSLALAVAHAESSFNARALSHAGARGVMQIMPATGRGEYGLHPDQLWDARINVRVGLHFLRRLIVRYGGRRDLALSYYNGGSRVGDGPSARVIPATRAYVDKVLRLERRYRAQLQSGRLADRRS